MNKQTIYEDISICHFSNCYNLRVPNTPYCEKHRIPVSREDDRSQAEGFTKSLSNRDVTDKQSSSDNQDKYTSTSDIIYDANKSQNQERLDDLWISKEEHEKEVNLLREAYGCEQDLRIKNDKEIDFLGYELKNTEQNAINIRKHYQRLLEDEQRQKAELHNEVLKLRKELKDLKRFYEKKGRV